MANNPKKRRADHPSVDVPAVDPVEDDVEAMLGAAPILADPIDLFLIDDDPMFVKTMKLVAAHEGISLTSSGSFVDVQAHVRELAFDVAIVDYDLGSVTGVEVSQYLEHFVGSKPTIVISISDRNDDVSSLWAHPYVRFVHKNSGHSAILHAAIDLVHSYRAGHTKAS